MPKQKIDCLFIHTPQDISETKARVMFMAMGLFALADFLQRHGYSSKIIHLGVERIANKKFSIENYLKEKDIRSIGISLHWHYQSNNCISLVNKIKAIQPKLKIILGGFTASFFSDEIMRKFKEVDFIVRGDAEIPLLNLMNEISKNKPDFSSIPNLTWRKDNKITHNKHSYVANEIDINKLNFSNFKLFKNFFIYSKITPQLFRFSKDLLNKHSTFILCVGRGCSVNCSFCGGSNLSQQIINKRKKIIFRSYEKVLETIRDAKKIGIDCLYVCFDPNPDRKYYIELFKLIRINKIDISMVFECWSLPTVRFINEFKKTFGKGKYSAIVLSPETGSETLRKLNKGFFYTNSEFFNILQYLKKKRIFTQIYFSYPLPYETVRDINATDNFIELIKRKIKIYGKILVQDFNLDPASPMFLFPARYKIIKKTKLFSDYCKRIIKHGYFIKGFNRHKFSSAYKKWLERDEAHELVARGWNYFKLKQYKKAIKEVSKAIDLDNKEDSIHLLLGLCYEKIKQHEKAIKELKKAEKITPKDPLINFSLSNCYRNIDQRERFNKELDKGVIKLKRVQQKTLNKN